MKPIVQSGSAFSFISRSDFRFGFNGIHPSVKESGLNRG
jgi:hypothetical protein